MSQEKLFSNPLGNLVRVHMAFNIFCSAGQGSPHSSIFVAHSTDGTQHTRLLAANSTDGTQHFDPPVPLSRLLMPWMNKPPPKMMMITMEGRAVTMTRTRWKRRVQSRMQRLSRSEWALGFTPSCPWSWQALLERHPT